MRTEMLDLVTKLDSVFIAIKTLNDSLQNHPGLADRFSNVHDWHVLENEGKPLFGFSKFIGYDGLTPEEYIHWARRDEGRDNLNGRDTKKVLSKWFEELPIGAPKYEVLFKQLTDWLDEFDKRPLSGESQKARLMVLRPKYRKATQA